MNDDFDNAKDDQAMLDRLKGVTPAVRCPTCGSDDPRGSVCQDPFHQAVFSLPRVAHEATYAPEGDGYLVTCPRGCPLGTSAHQPDEASARKRIELHYLTTAPLGPSGIQRMPS